MKNKEKYENSREFSDPPGPDLSVVARYSFLERTYA